MTALNNGLFIQLQHIYMCIPAEVQGMKAHYHCIYIDDVCYFKLCL